MLQKFGHPGDVALIYTIIYRALKIHGILSEISCSEVDNEK
jgi:hypothetical protein